MSNRVNKIPEKDFISWRHVSTDRNAADIGSRGCSVDKIPQNGGMDLHGYSVNEIGHQISILNVQWKQKMK